MPSHPDRVRRNYEIWRPDFSVRIHGDEHAQVDARRDEGVQGPETAQRVEERSGSDRPKTGHRDRTVGTAATVQDHETGISIKFVRQYDVKADMSHRCGLKSCGYQCDREAGHQGSHRSYNEQVDEPVFWSDIP